ncbi:cytochrome c maturation protein CcmE [Chelatococcus sambhunathii]|uniref:Cytochrome c-type biogenesis protein CcmE n=1 Tax=Chelatococcus sambhunathii TaxID=363953 RepID=A0ABU1DJS6_9HYPH|nr:cytochrome c maturation protein CcmE [Chelatococcus sambhunathii]MDR4308382.1 cytochrome c maturation protein CcmE [Chelatococcus sambhunathii]
MTVDASSAFPTPRRRASARKRRRLALLAVIGLALAAATALILNAFNDSLVFFRTPSELAGKSEMMGARLRLGGLVKQGSIAHEGTTTRFVVTDMKADQPVTYTGLLPDLFREGQGVVTEGAVGPDGVFKADSVLAKHDETYMPKDVADRLKSQGLWKEGEGAGTAAPKPEAAK